MAVVTVFVYTVTPSQVLAHGNSVPHCEACAEGIQESTGTMKQQNEAKKLVITSEQYKETKKKLNKEGVKLDWNSSRIYVGENSSAANLMLPVKRENTPTGWIQYAISYDTKDVIEISFSMEKVDDNTLNFSMIVNGEKVVELEVNENGTIINEEGQAVSLETYIAEAQTDQVSAFGWCENIANFFYTGVNGFTCNYACLIAAGITSFVGGLACVTLCGLARELSRDAFVGFVC